MTDCTTCKTPTDDLAIFPGGLCVDCWAKTPEGRYVPTAEELARMWGGKASEITPEAGA